MDDQTNFQFKDPMHIYRTELPNIIFDMGLTGNEFKAYAMFKKIAGDGGQCWYSNKNLTQLMGLSLLTIKELKKSLSEKGLIKITIRKNIDKSFNTSIIEIVDLWPKNFQHFNDKRLKKNNVKHTNCNDGVGKENIPRVGKENIPRSVKKIYHKEEPINKNHNNKSLVASQPAQISFSFKLNKFTNIDETQIDEWQKTFPEIDIIQEIEKATIWVMSKPARNKKRKKWKDLLELEWFPRAKESVKSNKHTNTKASDNKSAYDSIKPVYDRYIAWLSRITDMYFLNKGQLVLEKDCFYDKKDDKFRYKLNYDKFIKILEEKYKVPKKILYV